MFNDDWAPMPIRTSPIEATSKLGLIAKITLLKEKIPSENMRAFFLPKLSLKYENPISPTKTPNGKLNLARLM